MGVTKPEAGVIATRPATAPAAAPTTLGLPRDDQLNAGPDHRRCRRRDVRDDEGVARRGRSGGERR